MIAAAAGAGAGLVLLTETFSTGFAVDVPDLGEPEGGPSSQFLVDRAAEHGIWVGGSCPEIPAEPGRRPAPIQQLRPGRARRHRPPLPQDPPVQLRRRGEALPGRRRADDRRHRRAAGQPAGLLRPPLRRRVLAARRRDRCLPRARQLAREAAAPLDALLQARAIENQAYVVGVNRVGEGGACATAATAASSTPRRAARHRRPDRDDPPGRPLRRPRRRGPRPLPLPPGPPLTPTCRPRNRPKSAGHSDHRTVGSVARMVRCLTADRGRDLVKRFGDFIAVDGIDVEVRRGEAFGFLGPNGAGKSSTMRMIGCTSPVTGARCGSSGSTRDATARAIRARLGVVPQLDQLDDELTVEENLVIYGRYFDIPRAECRRRAAELLEFVQLSERAGEPGRAAVGRHEAAADDRPLADQRARAAAARRADDRARSAGPPRAVGPAVPTQAAGRHARPDHALHGRGRAALRPAGGDGQRAHRRRGLAPRADRASTRPRRCSSCASRPAPTRRTRRRSRASATAWRCCPTAC